MKNMVALVPHLAWNLNLSRLRMSKKKCPVLSYFCPVLGHFFERDIFWSGTKRDLILRFWAKTVIIKSVIIYARHNSAGMARARNFWVGATWRAAQRQVLFSYSAAVGSADSAPSGRLGGPTPRKN